MPFYHLAAKLLDLQKVDTLVIVGANIPEEVKGCSLSHKDQRRRVQRALCGREGGSKAWWLESREKNYPSSGSGSPFRDLGPLFTLPRVSEFRALDFEGFRLQEMLTVWDCGVQTSFSLPVITVTVPRRPMSQREAISKPVSARIPALKGFRV